MKNKIRKIVLIFSFIRNFFLFKKMDKNKRFVLKFKDRQAQLYDDTKETGFDAHYIYHPAWAARVIAQAKPAQHIDISSSLAFSTMLSAFIPVKFYDYRPAKINLSNLTTGQANLLNLPFPDESVSSLSCMHTIEHIGLGRYGDPIDPNGDLKAIDELKRVLAKNGNLLFVVPIGQPKIAFNAHRIYSYKQVMNYFSDLKLKEFSLIPDQPIETGIIKNASEGEADAQKYACGCFWFQKNNE